MKTYEERLLDRMEYVCRLKGWSLRDWAREAGLKEESHLHTISRTLRARAGIAGPTRMTAFGKPAKAAPTKRAKKRPVSAREPSIGNVETWTKLADAAGVRFEWLALGRGGPFAGAIEVAPDPVYPTRPTALVIAQFRQAPEHVIQALLAHVPFGGSDPGTDYWLDILNAEMRRVAARTK